MISSNVKSMDFLEEDPLKLRLHLSSDPSFLKLPYVF